MIESPRITVVLALVKLSAGGTIGVEIVLSTTLIFPFLFSLGRGVESFDLLYRSLERSLTTITLGTLALLLAHCCALFLQLILVLGYRSLVEVCR